MLTDDELERLEPRKTKTIDIEAFVGFDEIDPAYFDHPYFLVPTGGEGAARAYQLLVEVMERAGARRRSAGSSCARASTSWRCTSATARSR